ncbi:MAG: DNA polymerase IV [Parcubacteria group bacterium]|jgi:DNA polymerase-4/DNA polymerase V
MPNETLSINSFNRAIIHIDGDAFFASCEQSRDPALKGKPVITGRERGIAASLSYEAKARGVRRGMRIFEIKKICPEAIILPSDYETYSLLSKRFFEIVRRYTSEVEEYSIDECFADITGLRRPLRMSYPKIAEKIKQDLDRELGFTFSVGLGPNKTIAKIGSKWKKPSGLTVIPGYQIHEFLAQKETEDVWGIGPQTGAYLKNERINTALEFAHKDEEWVRRKFTKPTIETWQELNGKFILPLDVTGRTTYTSVQKVRTFTPPSNDRDFIFSQLAKNIENACIKLRRYNLRARNATFFLKLQSFRYAGMEIQFSRPTAIPSEIINVVEKYFDQIFDQSLSYRATGIAFFKLEEDVTKQLDLFCEVLRAKGLKKLYHSIDEINDKFGKHTVHLGVSSLANSALQHEKERGDAPLRKTLQIKGENKRQRIGIPMFIGAVT